MRKMKLMLYIIGVKVRIYPSDKEKRIIAKNAGAARFVYNRLVARDRETRIGTVTIGWMKAKTIMSP